MIALAAVTPLIERGEQLERERNTRLLTEAETEELRSIKLLAHACLAHTREFPLADSAQQEEAQYLAEQRQRDCDEVAEVMRRFVAKYGAAIVEAAVQVALTRR